MVRQGRDRERMGFPVHELVAPHDDLPEPRERIEREHQGQAGPHRGQIALALYPRALQVLPRPIGQEEETEAHRQPAMPAMIGLPPTE